MLQCEMGEEAKTTVHIQKKEQLRCKNGDQKRKTVYTIVKRDGLTTCGSSAAVAIASQMTP